MLNRIIESKPIRYLGVTASTIPFWFSTAFGVMNTSYIKNKEDLSPKKRSEQKADLESLTIASQEEYSKFLNFVQSNYGPNFFIPTDAIDVKTNDINGTETKDFLPGDQVVYNGTVAPHLIALVNGNLDYGNSQENLDSFFSLFGFSGASFSGNVEIPVEAESAQLNLDGMINILWKDDVEYPLNLGQMTVDKLEITAEDGTPLSNYSPGQNVKYNVTFTFDKTSQDRTAKVSGEVTYPSLGTFSTETKQLPSLEGGTYTATLEDTIPSNLIPPDSGETANVNVTVAIGDYQKQETSNFNVIAEIILSGRVENMHGDPLADLEILLNSDSITTDSQGIFSTELERGDYVLNIKDGKHYEYKEPMTINTSINDKLIQMIEKEIEPVSGFDVLTAYKILTGTYSFHDKPTIFWDIENEGPTNVFLNREELEQYNTSPLSDDQFLESIKSGLKSWQDRYNAIAKEPLTFHNYVDEDVAGPRIKFIYHGYNDTGLTIWEDKEKRRVLIYVNPEKNLNQLSVFDTTAHEDGHIKGFGHPKEETHPDAYNLSYFTIMGSGGRLTDKVTDLDGIIYFIHERFTGLSHFHATLDSEFIA